MVPALDLDRGANFPGESRRAHVTGRSRESHVMRASSTIACRHPDYDLDFDNRIRVNKLRKWVSERRGKDPSLAFKTKT